MCLPYLKFSDPLPETHLFFYLALFKFEAAMSFYSQATGSLLSSIKVDDIEIRFFSKVVSHN